jgi:hypothetical protein
LSSLPELLGASSRAAALVLLVAAPLAFGSVHREAYPVFLATAAFSGLASLARAAWCRRHGQALPRVPGARLLLALNLVVLIQATPLPAAAVRVLSPTSFSYHQTVFRLAPEAWRPISVNASLTWLGLFFLCALSLFYAGVFREFGHERRARALAGTIVVVATLMTLVGFVQKVSADPNRIYGIWKPPLAAHVFGPYPNRSHYAGYVVMAIPLALGLAVEALFLTRRLWSRRARGFTALGEPEGSAAALRLMLVLFNVAGVLAAGSRTAVLACALSTTCTLAAFGWNALGDAYAWRYQTVYKWGRWDEAHNEYLQVLLVTGVCGTAILLGLLWLLLRAALRAATQGPFGVGLFGACAANAITNLSDFNLQVPANAATFAAIAGLVIAYRHVPAETNGGDVSESGDRDAND